MDNLKRYWRKAKYTSMGLLVWPMMLASCNDATEEWVSAESKKMEVSATTVTPEIEARAIVKSSSLPSGAVIGVTLVDMDGNDYDNIPYHNMPYTSGGTGGWSGSDISLSTTFGKAIAYHPYSATAEGYQIPIETASQQDYMYSGWLEYLYNGAYKAAFTMKHGMTDIRFVIKSGTYTGNMNLQSITVESPFFATDAIMSIETGTLTSVTGAGTTLLAEYTGSSSISSSGLVHDFLTIPVSTVKSGTLNVTVMIGGHKFTTAISISSAFLQGRTYQYNLSLHNTGMTLESAGVVDWSYKAEVQGNMTEVTE